MYLSAANKFVVVVVVVVVVVFAHHLETVPFSLLLHVFGTSFR